MKNMRSVLAGLAGVSLVFCSVSAALAQGNGNVDRPDDGRGAVSAPHARAGNYRGLSEDKRTALNALMRERRAAVEPLREQLEARRLELHALSRNPNTRPADISKLAKETAGLHAQLRAVNRNFREKAQKELGVPLRERAGMRSGHGRHGRHQRYGRACGSGAFFSEL